MTLKRKSNCDTVVMERDAKSGAFTSSRIYPPGLKITIKNDRVLTDAGKKAVKNGILSLDDVLLIQK